MEKDFVAEARKGDQQTRTLICLEALRTDPTVKHRHLRKALETYKACLASNDWPGYSQEIQTLDLNKAPSEAPAPITFA